MNINRLRPTGVKDLAGWLSSVVNDAARDAREAGLSETMVHHILKSLADAYDPMGFARRAHGLPSHLADIAPSRRCDRCGRQAFTQTAFGNECGMPQPDGSRCSGRFEVKP
jgi:hypothetical protein